MSRNNRFWGNFWGEAGRNSGKWVSNKVFGPTGWATPKRHILSNEIRITEKAAMKTLGDLSESPTNLKKTSSKIAKKKKAVTNEFDVQIAEIGSKTLAKSIDSSDKENKFSFVIAIAVVGVLFTFIFIMHNYNNNNRIADEVLQLKLEKIELQINLLLKEGKNAEASTLIFELKHPSDKPIPSNTSVSAWLNGQETYNNYWMKKRAYYVEIVK